MYGNLVSAADRRASPRIEIEIAAELAAGSALVPVTIHDLSHTGCGIEILLQDPDLATKIGAAGLLHLNTTDQSVSGAILPVSLRNMRLQGNILRYGLEFRPLMDDQTRKLTGIMKAVVADGSSVVSAALAPDQTA